MRVGFIAGAGVRTFVVALAACVSMPGLANTMGQAPVSQPAAPAGEPIEAANQALAAGDFNQALKLLTVLREKEPKNPEVLYDLGLTLEALHPDVAAQPEAEANYRAAIAANPLLPLPHVALGLMLARSNRAPEAVEQLQTATDIPDIPSALKARALRALARIDLGQHHAQVASTELLKALQISPETQDDTLLTAEIAEATPDLPTAEQAYRKLLSSSPNDPNLTAALAKVLVAEKHPGEAKSLLDGALQAHLGDPTLTTRLAATLLASGDPASVAQAAPLLEKLHAANPGDPNITRLLARVAMETGHPDQAEALYGTLLGSAGSAVDPTLLDARAEALLRLHRPAEAEKLLQQAVANRAGFSDPNDFADAATHLAFAAAEIDDPRTTLQALELRATVQPPSLASLYLEATARDALHQSSQAVNLYKRFLAEANGTLPEQEAKARERLATLKNGR